MNSNNYRKYLLSRTTASPPIVEFIENSLVNEPPGDSLHKITVYNWPDDEITLYDILSDYFSVTIIPVKSSYQRDYVAFYTNNLRFVLKIIKSDFIFPYARNLFTLDIIFNDVTHAECFGTMTTIDDIINGVISNRFNEHCELDLSNFCNDPELMRMKIHFYKISLLAYFKITMIRIGRNTKSLNLSNNNLKQIPMEILNFFIKGDLIAVNLSNNNIPSTAELLRISSKIEKLWIEGNPLCEDMEPIPYVKQITMKFPRLTELDGVKLNRHGFVFPFHKNFLVATDSTTKALVENFLMLYFTHFDTFPRIRINEFYDEDATLSITTNFTREQLAKLPEYGSHSRNVLDPAKRLLVQTGQKLYRRPVSIIVVLGNLGETTHDPSTFTVDVLQHDNKGLVVVVDGVYKQVITSRNTMYFHFRRTFVFKIVHAYTDIVEYKILNEMFHVSMATPEQIENSFKTPGRAKMMSLMYPDEEDIETIQKIFAHLTQLNKDEVEARLKHHDYNLRDALGDFTKEYQKRQIPADKFIEEDDFSDISSLIDDEID